MKTNKGLCPVRLRLEELETRLAPASLETSDTTAAGALPTGWSQWSSSGTDAFAVTSSQALSTPNSLAVNSSASGLSALARVNAAQPANVQVGAAVYLNSAIPARVLARGSGLSTTTPTYYAAS